MRGRENSHLSKKSHYSVNCVTPIDVKGLYDFWENTLAIDSPLAVDAGQTVVTTFSTQNGSNAVSLKLVMVIQGGGTATLS
ncbi:MAG: hypothetical protein QXU32_05115 [Nitrososphaerales archaeon]